MTNHFDIFASVQQKLKKDASQVAGLVGMSLTRLADELLQPFMTEGARRIYRLHSAIDLLHSRGVEYGDSMVNIFNNGRVEVSDKWDDLWSMTVMDYVVAYPYWEPEMLAMDEWKFKILEGMNEYLNHLETK